MHRSINRSLKLPAVLLAVVLIAVPVDARTLEEYAQEVGHLREDFAVLIGNATGNADEDAERFEGEVYEERSMRRSGSLLRTGIRFCSEEQNSPQKTVGFWSA